jgi:hypothetical protein
MNEIERTDRIYVARDVPHDWLFSRVAAVVHHGGVGTLAAGLRAGCPTVIVPFFADQPFWARRARELGVGPDPIPRKHLSLDRLAQAISAATLGRRLPIDGASDRPADPCRKRRRARGQSDPGWRLDDPDAMTLSRLRAGLRPVLSRAPLL